MEIELKILDWIQGIRTPAGDVVMPFISRLGDAGFIWILLTISLLIYPKTRKSGAVLAVALVADMILCNILLKPIVCRTRPCDVNTAIELLVARPKDFSFPSGHTAASFTAVVALFFAREKRLWKPALVLAVGIAFSRMYLYVHYPTDILGGIIVGIAAGYLGYWCVKKIDNKRQEKQAER